MTVQQIDRDALRRKATDRYTIFIRPDDLLALLDQLDQAEARIEAWEKQYAHDTDYWIRAAETAEARIKAVEDVLDAVDGDYDSHGAHRLGVTRRIRRALDG